MKKFSDNFEIKMVGLDLDGTTLKYGDVLSERTLDTFRRAKEKGVHIVIATGRTGRSLPPVLFDVPEIEYVITSNGAHIIRLEDMSTIYEDIIKPEDVSIVVERARAMGYVFEAFVDGTAYIDRVVYEGMQREPEKYKYRDIEYVLRTRRPIEDIYSFTESHGNRIENISITFEGEDDRRRIFNELGDVDGLTLTSSFTNNVEIGGSTTSKAQALMHLLDMLHLTPENLMTCGDSPNDGKMIELAEVGVAMADSHPYILGIADYVTDTCFEDGVAKAIERFVL